MRLCWTTLGLVILTCGCVTTPSYTSAPPPGVPIAMLPNPLPLPPVDRDAMWDQVVDVVDDYFKIEREDRVKLAGELLTEGRIDTFPQTSATLLEPWRADSVNFDERLLATLQSMRRRCTVRLIPQPTGYLIDVTVLNELENLSQPEHSTSAVATFRRDDTLSRYVEQPDNDQGGQAQQPGSRIKPTGGQAQKVTPPLGWIPKGRDTALEQQMLAQIQARLAPGVPVAPMPVMPQPTPAMRPY